MELGGLVKKQTILRAEKGCVEKGNQNSVETLHIEEEFLSNILQ